MDLTIENIEAQMELAQVVKTHYVEAYKEALTAESFGSESTDSKYMVVNSISALLIKLGLEWDDVSDLDYRAKVELKNANTNH